MKYQIQHYYGKEPPVPEAVKVADRTEKFAAHYEIEIDDLAAWIAKQGNVIVSPPGHYPGDGWFIWVTDNDKFVQR